MALAPSLPAVATAMISKHSSQPCAPWSRPISVRRPVNAKNSGSSNTELNFSTRARMRSRKPSTSGITVPARNAPNNA